MPKIPTRFRLTNAQKQALHVHHRAHPEMSLMDAREWARPALELRVPPALSALCTLFDGPEPVSSSKPASKTQHYVTCPPLEAALVYLISICERMQLPLVSQATIRVKAAKIRESIMKDPTWSTNTALAQFTAKQHQRVPTTSREGEKSFCV